MCEADNHLAELGSNKYFLPTLEAVLTQPKYAFRWLILDPYIWVLGLSTNASEVKTVNLLLEKQLLIWSWSCFKSYSKFFLIIPWYAKNRRNMQSWGEWLRCRRLEMCQVFWENIQTCATSVVGHQFSKDHGCAELWTLCQDGLFLTGSLNILLVPLAYRELLASGIWFRSLK